MEHGEVGNVGDKVVRRGVGRGEVEGGDVG